MGFLAYVMDMRVATEGSSSISEVRIVCEFPDVGCASREVGGVPDQFGSRHDAYC